MSATTITGPADRDDRKSRNSRNNRGGCAARIGRRVEGTAQLKLLRADLSRTWTMVRGWDRTTKLLAGSAAALVPWIVFLALTLPTHTVAHNWSTVWIGFDLLLATAFAV